MADTFTGQERSRIMAAVKSKDTAPEMIVRRMVHALGFRYRLHVRALPGTPDMVFPRLRKIINVSGCFWHMHGCGRCRIPKSRRRYWMAKLNRNSARDKTNQRLLRRAGWGVMVVWECQTRRGFSDRLQARIIAFLKRPSLPGEGTRA
ncbi:MAG: very short patch repair endonuclease [Planctomycetia bacterium]|nr:very short patch repair endonuclease [Planctomycetia bacterium]